MSLNLVVIFQPRGVVSKMQIHMLLNFFHKGTRMVFSIRILEAMQINIFPKDRTSPLVEKVTPLPKNLQSLQNPRITITSTN